MSETTCNDIVIALSNKIDDIFKGKYSVYTDENKQDMKVPCFFIRNFDFSTNKFFDNRYEKRYMFELTFFTGNKEKSFENGNVKESLNDELEYLKVGESVLRCRNFECKEMDGVLICTFIYRFPVLRQKEVYPFMQTLTQKHTTRK